MLKNALNEQTNIPQKYMELFYDNHPFKPAPHLAKHLPVTTVRLMENYPVKFMCMLYRKIALYFYMEVPVLKVHTCKLHQCVSIADIKLNIKYIYIP